MGLETGDKILKIDGKPAERMETSMINMLFANEATVLRNGKEVTFLLMRTELQKLLNLTKQKLISPRFPAVIDSVAPNMGAQKQDY
jgi:regulator of sigma E protease